MGWLGESKYNCPECDGEGEVECCECGSEYACKHCAGTGWDPFQVDIEAFKKAVAALGQKITDEAGRGGIYEWIDRDTDTRLGRSGGEYGTVAAKDFLFPE